LSIFIEGDIVSAGSSEKGQEAQPAGNAQQPVGQHGGGAGVPGFRAFHIQGIHIRPQT